MHASKNTSLSLKRIFFLFLCVHLFISPSHASVPFGARGHVISTEATATTSTTNNVLLEVRGGGYVPAGWNPFGYKISNLGEQYLAFGESLDSDVGRFLTSLKTRKSTAALKAQWVEIVKVSKTGQTMRIYRTLSELLQFCLDAGLID